VIDVDFSRRITDLLRQTLAGLGPAAMEATERPDCRVAVDNLVRACKELEAKAKGQEAAAKAFDGTDGSAAALQDALLASHAAVGEYRRALELVSGQAAGIALESVGLGTAQ
jgi:hypothetical protein